MFKTHNAWDSTTTLLGLEQMVNSSTRITPSSSTLIDHIYTNKPTAVTDVSVGSLSISDHFPISCCWSTKLPKVKKGGHTFITYRSFKRFNENDFLFDLSNAPFSDIYNESDPNNALSMWYQTFLTVLNKHAPLKRKRVKHAVLPPWLNQDIIKAMDERDKLKQEKRFDEFKQERKRVRLLVRQAKKSLVDRLIKQEKDVSSLWRAMNVVTGGAGRKSPAIPSTLSAEQFNQHFLSIAQSLTPPRGDEEPYTCPDPLVNFCRERKQTARPFCIPPIAVHEVGHFISSMKSTKSSGPDEISPKILKLSLPYIVESLTFIFNMCIEQNIFPSELKNAKVRPLPKTKDLSDINNYRPISLLSVLCKPLERHVHKHLTEYLERLQLLHPHHSGFLKNHRL